MFPYPTTDALGIYVCPFVVSTKTVDAPETAVAGALVPDAIKVFPVTRYFALSTYDELSPFVTDTSAIISHIVPPNAL